MSTPKNSDIYMDGQDRQDKRVEYKILNTLPYPVHPVNPCSLFQRGKVARRQPEFPRFQDPAHDLSTARLGKLSAELDLAGRRMRGQLLAHKLLDFVLQLIAGHMAFAQRNKRLDDVSTNGIGLSNHTRFRHG